MIELFNRLSPEQYWKFFIDVAAWGKNDPLIFDKENSKGYFRACSLGLLWMLQNTSKIIDLDYILTLHSMVYHDSALSTQGLALDNISSGVSFDSFSEDGLSQLVSETKAPDTPSYYFLSNDEHSDFCWRCWENDANYQMFIMFIKHYKGLRLYRGHPDRKEQDSIFSLESVSFSAHSVQDIVNRVKSYIDCYNDEIGTVSTNDEKLRIIVKLIQHLHQFHLFYDGNGRTFCFFLLNCLLIREKLSPTIVEEPGRFTGWSVQELVNEVKKGQERFLNLCSPSSDISIIDTIKQTIHLTEKEMDLFLDTEDPEKWEEIQQNFIKLIIEGDFSKQRECLCALPFHLRISLLQQQPLYDNDFHEDQISSWLEHLRWLRYYGFHNDDRFLELKNSEQMRRLIKILHKANLNQELHWREFILALQYDKEASEILKKSIQNFFKLRGAEWFNEHLYVNKLTKYPHDHTVFTFSREERDFYTSIPVSSRNRAFISQYLYQVSSDIAFKSILKKIRAHEHEMVNRGILSVDSNSLEREIAEIVANDPLRKKEDSEQESIAITSASRAQLLAVSLSAGISAGKSVNFSAIPAIDEYLEEGELIFTK